MYINYLMKLDLCIDLLLHTFTPFRRTELGTNLAFFYV